MFFSLIDYLKNYETKISETEVPELQFLSNDLYKSETFNLNSVVKIISSKLKDTNYLISQLKLTVGQLKNEIVEQINSNFQNYVVLISKLQAIDFLIENIEKPLDQIKNKIVSEINFAEKYENELTQILLQIKENEYQISNIKLSIKFYKCYNKSKEMIKQIEMKYLSNNLFKNIINNHPDENILDKNNYEVLRKYLVNIFRFLTNIKNFYEVSDRLSMNGEDYSQLINEIRHEEIKFMIGVEDLLKILINEFFNDSSRCNDTDNSNQNEKTFNILLMKNLFMLIFKLYYIIPKNELILFTKILEISLQSEIEIIFETANKSLTLKFGEMYLLYDKKYKILQEIINDFTKNENNETKSERSEFYLNCFISEVINRLYSDKFIFNCVDSDLFRDNYNSFLNYVGKFINSTNFNKFNQIDIQQVNKIKNFSQSFSFFTYFQFIQNEILKILLDDFSKSQISSNEIKNEDVSIDFLEKMLINQNNFLFNFTKITENIFRDRKLFLKNIPNFIYFIGQSLKYVIKKQKDLFSDNNIKYFMNLVQTDQNFSFTEESMHKIKRAIIDYTDTLSEMLNYFFYTINENENSKFIQDLIKVVEREIFMFENDEDYFKLLDKLKEFVETNRSYLEKNVNFKEEPFLKFISENEELRRIKN